MIKNVSASSTTRPGMLPSADSITERSRKFYDGTYTWDSEGFTDDMGVYRTFDCYDPDARAPTPLPPMFLSDDEGDEVLQCGAGASIETLALAPDVENEGIIATARCDESSRGHADKKNFIGEKDGALQDTITPPASPAVKKPATARVGNKHRNPITPPKDVKSKVQTPSPSSSGLSDCPSDLSEWDVGLPVSIHANSITFCGTAEKGLESESKEDYKDEQTARVSSEREKVKSFDSRGCTEG
ncbi:hypothetical protein COCMIDRAFT_83840 [Bipolaris oryzae ATCC 44560]|uniref:Uncharacterized protein n=1 Tax=Bipolaris oryzae ATCC 44560 TaxID=930090 RepID=W7A101_COCMI|nr:uncharacterized protein COCMIDRAFT_83840 [Bipolaris oryzae ATCC 44560]EUC49741.1 hypothetical protein COCMIDRAFT_83840 [Bipolaris oryzae ATCC 44560]